MSFYHRRRRFRSNLEPSRRFLWVTPVLFRGRRNSCNLCINNDLVDRAKINCEVWYNAAPAQPFLQILILCPFSNWLWAQPNVDSFLSQFLYVHLPRRQSDHNPRLCFLLVQPSRRRSVHKLLLTFSYSGNLPSASG